jgi:hypothetical protein
MKDITTFLLDPTLPCGCDEQHCPLLRTCPGCRMRFVTTRNRRQHSHACPGEVDALLEAAQHAHLIEAHRIRSRRRGRAKG